ncbi:GNAT family N-acetyltransferase [Parasphingopyxis lamellibrachiae]|uniref:RimJ/RimL family protein N-acetyltransferase n=1 Tax=Parasphingopyxis lamellibrachiae TaxID=680125 RepID=A0A3D9FH00_9SPHN|nr:GNAT family N-acetyltransferase [Parasphingopyxis lamellibrachiae]RED16366.1 RimJ/RimL family protein N-acetyltransferase [Parasphingopyxis lamellibrachiae]
MFAVTKRLLLRPGWAEDAPALAKAVDDERIARNTARIPWPYTQKDAEEYLAREQESEYPNFQIIDRTVDPVRLIGRIGFMEGEGAPEFGYWIRPDSWNQGYATEAAKAALAAVRSSLGYNRIIAGHFVDNPASGRVLEKLGFRRIGQYTRRFSLARGYDVECEMFESVEEDMALSAPSALAA